MKTFPDPLKVRETTAEVAKSLKFISINQEKIKSVAKILKKRIQSQRLLTEVQFGTPPISPQRVFILDVVNFCFWSKKGKPKWRVEYPEGKFHDGWSALTTSFDRALAEGIPLLDADFIATISQKDLKHILRSSNQTEIPLLDQRTAILRETGAILKRKFNGNFNNLLRQANQDAIKIAKAIIDHFQSFIDVSYQAGKKICFFKRAQILSYDLSLLKNLRISNIDKLTAFADYKLPQILRSTGVLSYKKPLAQKVDSLKLIPKDSRGEVEIRAATIQVCERLASLLKASPATIDNALWILSQEKRRKMKPYHRTLTTMY